MFNKFFESRKKDKTHYSEEFNEFSFLMHQYDNLSDSRNTQNQMLWSAPAMFLTAQSFLLVIAFGALSDVEWWARATAAFISSVFGFISIQKFERDRLMVVSDAEQLLDIEKKMIKLGHPGMTINDKQARRKYLNNELLEVKLKKDKRQTHFNSLGTTVFWEIGMWITTAISLCIFLMTILLKLAGGIQNSDKSILSIKLWNFDMRIISMIFLGILLSIILMILDFTFNPGRLSLKKGKTLKILLCLILVLAGPVIYFVSIPTGFEWSNAGFAVLVLAAQNYIYIFRIRKLKIRNKELENIRTLVLAGGEGSRLSEITKNEVPKFLAVKSSGLTLLENAVLRNKEVSGQVEVLSHKDYKENIDRERKKPGSDKLNKKSILNDISYEKYNRGTGTAIFNYLKTLRNDPILIIVPSDHVIHDIHSYKDDIKDLCKLARHFNYIYLIGIEPNYPATDYGYFAIEENISYRITKICGFKEKPKIDEVKDMIKAGQYYWNSGIFVAKASVFQQEFEKHCLNEFKEYSGKEAYDGEAYSKSQVVSFDKAVLEKSERVYALIGSFDWIDIGDPTRLQGAIKEDICNLNEKYFMGSNVFKR